MELLIQLNLGVENYLPALQRSLTIIDNRLGEKGKKGCLGGTILRSHEYNKIQETFSLTLANLPSRESNNPYPDSNDNNAQ